MAEITLVRQPAAPLLEPELAAARRALFGMVDGLGDLDRRRWRGFVRRLLALEPGEMAVLRTTVDRLGWFHRKHMALEQRVFEAQERFERFQGFRDWLKIGAGLVEWVPGPKGGIVPLPLSISYAKLEQQAMEEFHESAVAFLQTAPALKALWPKAAPAQREAGMAALLESFGEGFGAPPG